MEGIVSHVKVTNRIEAGKEHNHSSYIKSELWLLRGQWAFTGKKNTGSPDWSHHSIHVRENGDSN